MNDPALQRGLVRIATVLIAITLAAAMLVVFLPESTRRDVWISLSVVLMAMGIGFVPLRTFLRHGPDRIVAAWVAAMILRMFACLLGLVIILKRYDVGEVPGIATVCGGYLVLLLVEAVLLGRIVRDAFERTAESQEDR